MPMPKDCMLFGYADKLTAEQREYVDSIFDNQVTIVNSVAGTGKTTLAVMVAKVLKRDLYYVFSPVEEGVMGFTPGSLQEKEAKYITPLKDALLEIGEDPVRAIVSEENLVNIKNGNAWVNPMSHVFARGMNIKGSDKFLLIDEAQNLTKAELRKMITRVSDSVKVVIIGHEGQCDLRNSAQSGFIPYLEFLKDEEYVKVCNLTKNFRGRLAAKADEIPD